MSSLTVRLNEADQCKLESLVKRSGGIYKNSEILGAAITMIAENNLYVEAEKLSDNLITFERIGNAYYLYYACVDENKSKLIRDIEINNLSSAVTVMLRKGTVVRALPPNILEFGTAGKIILRLFVYESIEVYSNNGQKLDYKELRQGSEMLKIIM